MTFRNKSVELTYSFFALTKLDEDCGINIFEKTSMKRLSPAQIRDLVWAGLLELFPDASRDEVAKAIGGLKDMAEWLKLVEKAVKEATAAVPADARS